MKKITAKYINNNLEAMAHGERIMYRREMYFTNGTDTIYKLSEDELILGGQIGYEYAKIIDGVAYRV